MSERPGLSKGEMEVARLLWEMGSGTVREVFEKFPRDRGIDFTTVQTYLRRLEGKGYVTAKLVGRTRVYRPRVKSTTVIREALRDFVERLFGGEKLPLVRHLIEEGDMTTEEIATLRRVLDQLDNQSCGREERVAEPDAAQERGSTHGNDC